MAPPSLADCERYWTKSKYGLSSWSSSLAPSPSSSGISSGILDETFLSSIGTPIPTAFWLYVFVDDCLFTSISGALDWIWSDSSFYTYSSSSGWSLACANAVSWSLSLAVWKDSILPSVFCAYVSTIRGHCHFQLMQYEHWLRLSLKFPYLFIPYLAYRPKLMDLEHPSKEFIQNVGYWHELGLMLLSQILQKVRSSDWLRS